MNTNTTETKMDVRFFFNGIKINGVMFLSYVWAYMESGRDNAPVGPYVAISLQGYGHFPAEFRTTVKVENNSDLQSDYFDHDRFEVRPGSPYWPGARTAGIKALEREIARRERAIVKRPSPYAVGELAAARTKLEAFRLTPAV